MEVGCDGGKRRQRSEVTNVGGDKGRMRQRSEVPLHVRESSRDIGDRREIT